MQIFAPLLALASVASAAAITPRAVTADALVSQLNKLTTMAQQITPKVYAIQTGENAVYRRQLTNPFQPAIDGAVALSNQATADIKAVDGTKAFGSADAQKVCTAFTNFVSANQELLKVYIGKSGLAEGIFLGPVAASLRSLENSYDTYMFSIIDVVPACESTVTQKKDSLDDTLGKAVCAYTPGGSLGVDLFC